MNSASYSHFTDEQTDLKQLSQLTPLVGPVARPLMSYSQARVWSPAGGEGTSGLQVSVLRLSLGMITASLSKFSTQLNYRFKNVLRRTRLYASAVISHS